MSDGTVMLKLSRILVTILIVSGPGTAANESIQRLEPSQFPRLPADIRSDLEKRGCRVPQTFMSKLAPHNVIQGHFYSPDQLDWAILCSVKEASVVLVYRDGCGATVETLGQPVPDMQHVQGVGDGRHGFSRRIEVVGRRYILERHEALGGPAPPPIDHEGINDVFVEKGSIVRYWYAGKWLRLTGAD